MDRILIRNRIVGEIQESDSALRYHMKEDEMHELAERITDGVVGLLVDHGESAEGVFDMDIDEQSVVVVIDKLKKLEV